MEDKLIFKGMPTLLGDTIQKQFSRGWPSCRELPPLENKAGLDATYLENFDLGNIFRYSTQAQPKKKKKAGQSSAFELRKVMRITKCPHKDKKHYAKNMCSDCYHKKAKESKATVCGHAERKVFARNMCLSCYTSAYRAQKKQK